MAEHSRVIDLRRQRLRILGCKFAVVLSIAYCIGLPVAFAQDIDNVPELLDDTYFLPDEELLGFVEIPAGEFTMGSNPLIDPMAFENERWSEGRRQGRVELPSYYIGKYEVTAQQYRAFVEDTDYRAEPSLWEIPALHPAAMVSWTDAIAYARWLEAQLKASDSTPLAVQSLLSAGWHISIPTEAQWEKAARGPGVSIYPWGNRPNPTLANYDAETTTMVGSFACRQCAYGLQDMSGNVWEWTSSPYQPYPFDPSDDREQLADDALWVMRGGSFSDAENNIRVSVRGAADPGARRDFIGFRLVLSKE
ncbi:MAG: SUMF1/EgtB/PvdO family nonheme iron enzyme [Pseudohongiellaceae bacterium]|nr:SUMF1/EgtB/PvdO family nonheme iron enzyme [Pseudohongiellaceae bacterium]